MADNTLTKRLSDENQELKEQLKDLTQELSVLNAELEKYKSFGDTKEISEAIAGQAELMKLQSEMTSINESFGSDSLDEVKSRYAEAMAKNAEYTNFFEEAGQPEEIKAALDAGTDKVTEINDILSSLQTTLDELKSFKEEYGTLPEAKKAIDNGISTIEKIQEEKVEASMDALAAEYGIDRTKLNEVAAKLNTKDVSAIRELLELTHSKVDPDQSISESFTPGASFGKMLTGSAFNRQPEEINEDYQGKFQRRGSFSGDNSPERAARLL